MATNTTVTNPLSSSNVFLSIVCALLVISSFVFNFTFLITLLKQRRLYSLDKSNFLLTHLILVDFVCSFFVLIPSGYSVYNSDTSLQSGCFVQTYFTTLFYSITFYGLLLLSIERYIKYNKPVSHINFFTRRLEFNKYDQLINDSIIHKVFFIILGVWILGVFIAFIPMFNNYGQIQYFPSQSQCDYTYETFRWWLWIYFVLFVTIPFIASLVFFFLTFRLINKYERIVKMKRIQFENEQSRKGSNKRSKKSNVIEDFIEGVDVSLQPCNQFYYTHIIDVNVDKNNDEEEEDETNDFHVRNILLSQFKYDTEKSKTITFFIITVLNYCILFPVLVIHFYRAYNNTKTANDLNGFDNPSLVAKSTYTAFVWISYSLFILKSFVCLVQNKFYKQAFYQAANCRGFSGSFDFQKELREVKMALNIGDSNEKLQSEA
jgi:hypothetical protein